MMENARRLMESTRGWMWRNATILSVDVEVDPGASSEWLPCGLRASRPAKATLFVADYPETSFGSVYREAAVLLHSRWLGLLDCVHCPWMLVDDDVALILGRECLGYPKKMGEISLSVQGDRVSARVERAGTRLFEMTGELGETDLDPPALLGQRTVNAWGLAGMSLTRLLMFTPREEILEARKVNLRMDVQGSDRDPLHQLKVGTILQARLYRTHIGAGRIPPVPVGLMTPLFLIRNWPLRFR